MCQLGETCCSHELEEELRDVASKDQVGRVRDTINNLVTPCSLVSLTSKWVGVVN